MKLLPKLQPLPRLSFDVLTPAVIRALGEAAWEAERAGYDKLLPEHLFVALLGTKDGGVAARTIGGDEESLRKARGCLATSVEAAGPLSDRPERRPYEGVGKIMARSTKLVLRRAIRKAKALAHCAVGTEHVVLALLEDEGEKLGELFECLQVNPQECYERIHESLR